METIDSITIKGFKSIKSLDSFQLQGINVLIGANGAGKSNFISFFTLLRELINQRLQIAVNIQGGADACLYLGPRETPELHAAFKFGENGYEFTLTPTHENRLIFSNEATHDTKPRSFGQGHSEAKLRNHKDDPGYSSPGGVAYHVFEAIDSWRVYHFNDTSSVASVRRSGQINDNEFLRPGGENLAAFLLRLQTGDAPAYAKIRDTVRLAAPFFDDFILRPIPVTPHLTQLEWRQQGSDYPFLPSQLSDGTLRFICLATALLQPQRPATVLFDEPELGLHPYALSLLAGLIKQASSRTIAKSMKVKSQVIVSTQSPLLLNEFDPEEIIVVERSQGESSFRRLNSADLKEWLSEYTLGELWQKNLLGGRQALESHHLQSVL